LAFLRHQSSRSVPSLLLRLSFIYLPPCKPKFKHFFLRLILCFGHQLKSKPDPAICQLPSPTSLFLSLDLHTTTTTTANRHTPCLLPPFWLTLTYNCQPVILRITYTDHRLFESSQRSPPPEITITCNRHTSFLLQTKTSTDRQNHFSSRPISTYSSPCSL
jgi:hypothetical protein